MKRLFFAFILLCGISLCADAAGKVTKPWDNGRLTVSANQRYLQFQNGTPFFWLGDTGWLLPERLDQAEAQYYLLKCREAGYNMVQIQVINNVPAINIYGQLSHPYGWDMSKADPDGVYSYWDHLDYIVDAANRNGIYIGMVAIWGSQIKSGNINVEQAKVYGDFLGRRYAKYPNIVWIMGGDIQGDIHPEIWEALATSIKAVDKNHLMTYHPRGRYTSARWWSKASWIDFHTFQSGHRRYGQRMGNVNYPIPDDTEEDNWMYVDSTWSYKPIKPVLDAEPSYEGIPVGLHDANEPRWQDYDVRRYAYWSVFAGSCGHTYGHNSIMQMLKPGYPTGYGRHGKEKFWYQALEDPGFSQMKYLKSLILAFPYFERVPDQKVILGKNGTKYDRLIATRGEDYLMVYNYNGVPMKVNLSLISGKKKNVWWMDAATGKLTFVGTESGKQADFQPVIPAGKVEDGVLIAVDASKNYISPSQKNIMEHPVEAEQRDLNE